MTDVMSRASNSITLKESFVFAMSSSVWTDSSLEDQMPDCRSNPRISSAASFSTFPDRHRRGREADMEKASNQFRLIGLSPNGSRGCHYPTAMIVDDPNREHPIKPRETIRSPVLNPSSDDLCTRFFYKAGTEQSEPCTKLQIVVEFNVE